MFQMPSRTNELTLATVSHRESMSERNRSTLPRV